MAISEGAQCKVFNRPPLPPDSQALIDVKTLGVKPLSFQTEP
jgi:hypothetical protein